MRSSAKPESTEGMGGAGQNKDEVGGNGAVGR